MKRVRIFALRDESPKVFAVLHELGAVQLEQADRASFFGEASPPSYAREVADEAFRFEGLATSLPRVPVTETLDVGDVHDVLAKAREINIDDDVRRLKAELESVDVQYNRNRNYLQTLKKIANFDKDLSILETKSLNVGFYSVPADLYEEYAAAMRAISPDCIAESYSSNKEEVTALVTFKPSFQEAARAVIEKYRATKLDVPTHLGKPSDAIAKLQAENLELDKRRIAAENALLEISKKYYGRVLAIREALNIEAQRFDALGRAGQSERTFVIEGWIPVTRFNELVSKLNSALNRKVVLEETQTKDLPPTLLQNSSKLNYFEFFVRFFSLPQSEEIDPTWTVAIVFPIFFGMMLGDVGYGLVILLIGFWFVGISTGKAKTKWLPTPIRKFGKSLIPKRALGSLGRILIPSAIVGMIFGILVNAYFGFKIPFYKPVFDLISAPQIYLVITLFVGLAHITLGYLYGIYIALHWGHKRHAYGKIGWLGFLWSGVAALYAVFSSVLGVPISPIVLDAGLAGLVVFGGMVFYFERMRFVMEIPTIISHVVSYGRILGVLLASFLLGYIASVSLEGAIGGPIAGFLVTLVVLLLVTILNIVLGIFEPAIQGIRLHYVEFYSKFFEGNGKRFQPFAEKRQLTKKIET